MVEILKLGAAVAIAEWVNIVHVAHDAGCRIRECADAQFAKKVGLCKSPVDVGHARFDELAKLELLAALGDLHCPQLSRPGVDILKQVAVDRAKVSKVKVTGRCAFNDPLSDKPPLHTGELIGISEAKPVSKDAGAWVEVRIVSAHSAASGTAWARI